MTKAEHTSGDSYSFVVTAAVEEAKARKKQEQTHKREVTARFKKLVKNFDSFNRGYQRLSGADLEVMWSPQASNSLPGKVWDLFKVQTDSDVFVSAEKREGLGRSLSFDFRSKDLSSCLFGLHINASSEALGYVVEYSGSKPTDEQIEAKEQLDGFVNASLTPEQYETRLYVAESLIEYAREQTEAFARRTAAGSGK